MKPPRIRDVAALAGVAPSTVSVVLNDVAASRISDDTRRRVHEAAEALGYTPNAAARSLRKGPERALLLVACDGLGHLPYGLGLVQGLQDACWERGVQLLTVAVGTDPAREAEALRFAAGAQVVGTVLASVYHQRRAVPRERNLLCLNIEPDDGGARTAAVVPDEAASGRLVADELVALGHRRVALLGLTESLEISRRREAFVDALVRGGLAPGDIVLDESPNHDGTASGGWVAATRVLELPERPSAIACFNDRMAMGAYRAAADKGLRIPDDVSIIGHDDLEPVAESLEPPLTTVAPPYAELGELAAGLMLESGGSPSPGIRSIPGELVRRRSAAAPGHPARPPVRTPRRHT
ncbi:LacI family DNA-binding transcriptional regulator [Intrasporangium sp.]|uniref:LacI family DNA-binding transcriptional regulator n=1 Tax=Intrasporangium sp. TaxID=1925024 RepID=UPI003221F77B